MDLHLDFSDDSRHRTIESVTRRTLSAGLQGRVAVGHVTSLGAMGRFDGLPNHRIHRRGGRNGRTVTGDRSLSQRAWPRASALPGSFPREGSDCRGGQRGHLIEQHSKCVHAFRHGNLLEIGLLLACTAHMSTVPDRALIPRLFTYNAAKALGIEEQYGIAEGRPADFAVFDTENFADLIIDQPEKRYVVKSGRIVVENVRETRWPSG